MNHPAPLSDETIQEAIATAAFWTSVVDDMADFARQYLESVRADGQPEFYPDRTRTNLSARTETRIPEPDHSS